MHAITTAMIGTAVTDVRHAITQSGLSMARFRMVSQPRRFDASVGAYVDQEASFVTVFAWRAMADHIAASIRKGDPVVVVGRMRVREWSDDGRPRVTVEVDAQSVGHDLSRGTARFARNTRRQQPDSEPGESGAELSVVDGQAAAAPEASRANAPMPGGAEVRAVPA